MININKLNKKQLGQLGEDMASEYLRLIGYRVLMRNYRCRYGEIDILAKEGGDLVFVEVRAKRSSNYGSAAESVNWRKQQKLRQLAMHYIAQEVSQDTSYRFDVVTVKFEVGEPVFDLIRNAF